MNTEEDVSWLADFRRINPFRVILCGIKFQTTQFSISIHFVYKHLNVKTVLFQTIHFSLSAMFPCQKQFYF